MRVDTYLSPIRFGVFELDLRTGELRKKGAKVKLDGQPIHILMLLLERPGELLTHEEIRAKLWPDGTVVEFESSIKTALRKLRQALGDDAEAPRYIENLPRRGYRFIAPVDGMVAVGAGLAPPMVTPEGEPFSGTRAPQGMPLQATPGAAVREPPLRTQWALRTAAVLAMLVVGLAVGWLVWNRSRPLPELKQKRLTWSSPEIPVLRGAISPDGKYVAYSDPGGLHLKVLESGEPRTLPRPPDAPPEATWNLAGWVPDGTQLLANLVQTGDRSSIWAVSVVEESPRLLCKDATGWAVSPDGSHIAFTVGTSGYNQEIRIMSPKGEDSQKVVAAAENESLRDVQWSPHGAAIAYISTRQMPDGVEMSIRTSALAGGKPIAVVSDPTLAAFSWLPSGRLIYARFDSNFLSSLSDGNLWDIPVDLRTGEPSGKPTQLTRWAGFGVENLSSTADGRRLAFMRRSWQHQAYLGQLGKEKNRMQPPRRLTFSDAQDAPLDSG